MKKNNTIYYCLEIAIDKDRFHSDMEYLEDQIERVKCNGEIVLPTLQALQSIHNTMSAISDQLVDDNICDVLEDSN